MNIHLPSFAVPVAVAILALFAGRATALAGNTHTLTSTIVNSGPFVFLSVPANTFTNVDSLTSFTCANTAGCTVIAHTMGQALGNPSSGNGWNLCTYVDGFQMNNTCWVIDALPTDGTAEERYTAATLQVAKGIHQIQTQVYMSKGGVLQAYQFEYQILKP